MCVLCYWRNLMTQSVNGVNNAGSNKQVKVSRQSELTVRTGESLSVLA